MPHCPNHNILTCTALIDFLQCNWSYQTSSLQFWQVVYEQYVCEIWTRGEQDISLLTVVDPNQWLSCLSQTWAYVATHVTLHSKYKAASPANTKQSFFNFFAEKFLVPREVTITRHVSTLMPNLRPSHLQIF